ncbi:MAG: TIGR00730 family Rossman fold protein [Candidatus Taylorbacteria bacterium]|nr:TIGR00730 family Rossman fold protein [Candidatus Taylorbacteria bacterium]
MASNEKENESEPEGLSRETIRRIIKAKVHRIDREFTLAFEFIKNYEKSVSFFGSARFTENNPHYQKARGLAKKISALGYTILTGGGRGIMEAANRAAFETGRQSVGLNIRLPHHQILNSYTTDSIQLDYFFVRKVALSFAAEAYLFFPGGFGTCDEFFEILTLIQTRKIRRVPIILVGADYWNELHGFIKNVIYGKHKAIDPSDMDLYTITDDEEKILEIIKRVPIKLTLQKNGL